MSSGVLAAGAVLSGVYATSVEPYWLEITRRRFRLNGLGPDCPVRRIAQISDLHICDRIDLEYLRAAFRQISAENPDLVVITGDIITLESGWSEGLDYLLPHIPRGRFGTLAVLGNHDYGSSFSDGSFADKISERFAGSGIQLLRNQESIFEGLRVIGLDDLWARRTDARLLTASPVKALPTIVLAHNPDTFDLPELDGFIGLMLSGHTHGGQCRPPFLPPPLLPVKNRNYTEGLFVNKTNGSLYINRGVGFLVRARFNVRPEATIIDLC